MQNKDIAAASALFWYTGIQVVRWRCSVNASANAVQLRVGVSIDVTCWDHVDAVRS